MTYIFYSMVFGTGGKLILLLSSVLSVVSVGIIACIVYYVLLRPRIESLTYVLVITLALALFIGEIMSLFFGVAGTSVPSFVEGSHTIGGIKVINQQLLLFPVAGVVLSGLWVFLKNTKTGQGIDAVAQQRDGAVLMGVNVVTVNLIASGLSASLAALAGTLIAPVSSVVPHMWVFPLIKAFAIAILGGIGSLAGSIIASFILGYAEVFSSFLISDQLTEMLSLFVIVFVLLFRPQGIMGFRLK
ncbi:MAG: branched-chain amino acid ABC transporter permease [Deltaproteobacteria bacterium]|nr:branched-chain amino acid ABC transporter permease [Deltaproteobacteria bacterium]